MSVHPTLRPGDTISNKVGKPKLIPRQISHIAMNSIQCLPHESTIVIYKLSCQTPCFLTSPPVLLPNGSLARLRRQICFVAVAPAKYSLVMCRRTLALRAASYSIAQWLHQSASCRFRYLRREAEIPMRTFFDLPRRWLHLLYAHHDRTSFLEMCMMR